MKKDATQKFGRLITAMVTPFDAELELDLNRAQELATKLLAGGNDSLVICGTTGESPTVFYPQKIELFKAVIEAVGDKLPIIANVGDNCTKDSIDFAKDVARLGVDGVMLVVPYYNKPPQEGLYRHFRAIAENVDLPVILYNIPGRCVINMTAETTLRLAKDVENIVAIKEASGDMAQVAEIAECAPEGFEIYSGDDEITLNVIRNGGYGVISTIGNIASSRMKEIIELEVAGKSEDADAACVKLLPLMKELFVTANPIMVKKALELSGFGVGGVRLPLIEADEIQSRSLAKVMREVGVI
jgi:4-hydroxy-tetrahydrodipicolinate synthase